MSDNPEDCNCDQALDLEFKLECHQARLNELRVLMDEFYEAAGCGDNSCRYVKPTGMGTNGGCRCWDRHIVQLRARRIIDFVRTLVGGK
jgi:hypothetical protein